MMQKIYLCRHGETNKNKYFNEGAKGTYPKKTKLSLTGKYQSKILGMYLNTKINKNELVQMIISSKSRTKETAKIIIQELNETNIDKKHKYIIEPEFDEQLYKELTKEPKNRNSKEWIRWKSYENKYGGNFPELKTKKQLGKKLLNILNEHIKKNKGKTIILILHDYVMQCLLDQITKSEIKFIEQIDNGDLIYIERDEDRIIVKKYISNKKLI